MYSVNVTVETYSERYCSNIVVVAVNEDSARAEVNRKIHSRHGKDLKFIQITGIKRIA